MSNAITPIEEIIARNKIYRIATLPQAKVAILLKFEQEDFKKLLWKYFERDRTKEIETNKINFFRLWLIDRILKGI